MKFKPRKKRIQEYNEQYPARGMDPETALRRYFDKRNWNFEKACRKASKKLVEIEEKRQFETIRVVMYEYPMKTDRPRVFKGHTFSPNAKENHDYFEKAVKSVTKTLKLINTPAEIEIRAYLEMPKKVPPDEVILFEAQVLNPIEYPDYDNIGKCYTDMLKEVLVIDDDLFYRGEITKYFSVTPRVEITIRYLTAHESEYLYKKIKGRKSVKKMIQNGQCDVTKLS